jgi:hypothetical protein
VSLLDRLKEHQLVQWALAYVDRMREDVLAMEADLEAARLASGKEQ